MNDFNFDLNYELPVQSVIVWPLDKHGDFQITIEGDDDRHTWVSTESAIRIANYILQSVKARQENGNIK